MFTASNPVLKEDTIAKYSSQYQVGVGVKEEAMTVQGTVNKTLILFLLMLLPASYAWSQVAAGNTSIIFWGYGGLIVGFILAMIISFKPTMAPMLSPLYALAEGIFLGGISAQFEGVYTGIVMQAIGLTFGICFGVLFLYKTGIIKAQGKFMRMVSVAMFGIMAVYLVSMVMSFFGGSVSFIHSSGPIGIGFSLFVCAIAAFMLIHSFDLIERGAKQGAPKYMEWYGAFAVMVGLVWLYLEILMLLAKLRGGRR